MSQPCHLPMSFVSESRKQIKQCVAIKKGGPLTVVAAPHPEPGAREICIRNRAVALNPVDWKRIHHGILAERWPIVLGIDMAGIVEAVGQGVTEFKPGDPVMSFAGLARRGAAFQEVATVPAHFACKKPENWTFEEAASVPLIYLTAVAVLTQGLGLSLPHLQGAKMPVSAPRTRPSASTYPDEDKNKSNTPFDRALPAQSTINPTTQANGSNGTKQTPPATDINPHKTAITSILLLGGSSGVGSATLQLLRTALPNAVVITTNAPRHNARLGGAGVAACVDHHGKSLRELVAAVRDACVDLGLDGGGVDAIVDVVSVLDHAYVNTGGGDGGRNGNGAGNGNEDGMKNGNGGLGDEHDHDERMELFSLLRENGPRVYAAVATTERDMSAVPAGVKAMRVYGGMAFQAGGTEVMARLQGLVERGEFGLPVEVEVIGEGLETVAEGLERLGSGGMSGTKLVVRL